MELDTKKTCLENRKHHSRILKSVLRLCVLLFSFLPLKGQNPGSSAQNLWKKISPFFSPPQEYKGQYGSHRSPLKFYNGNSVKTAADWKLRRQEIYTRWNQLMGEWPPMLKDQKIKIINKTEKDGYTQLQVTFKWLPNEETEGYLLIPDGKGKKPAVITVYYEPETAIGMGDSLHPNRDYAYQLVKRGFVALSIGTTKATNEKTYGLYYPGLDNTTVQPLSMLAYAAGNAWYVLSKLPEVNSSKIGIVGHSFGGKWAMFASCLFDKFACAVWSDPGIVFDETDEAINYWEPWYLGYHPKPWRKRGVISKENPAKGLYSKLVSDGYDLHELHALMAPRPFLVSGGSGDREKRWIPLNHTIAVNSLMNYRNRVAMTNRPTHGPTPKSNEVVYQFFEYFLKYNGLN